MFASCFVLFLIAPRRRNPKEWISTRMNFNPSDPGKERLEGNDAFPKQLPTPSSPQGIWSGCPALSPHAVDASRLFEPASLCFWGFLLRGCSQGWNGCQMHVYSNATPLSPPPSQKWLPTQAASRALPGSHTQQQLESPVGILNHSHQGSSPGETDSGGLGCALGIGTFQSFPYDSNRQQIYESDP